MKLNNHWVNYEMEYLDQNLTRNISITLTVLLS